MDPALIDKAKKDAELELERIKVRDELNKALENSELCLNAFGCAGTTYQS